MSNFTDFFPSGGGASGSGGYIPGIIGFEYMGLSGGGAGGEIDANGRAGGAGGGGTLIYQFGYTYLGIVTPVIVGAGGSYAGSIDGPGGSTIIGDPKNLLVTTILGGGGAPLNQNPVNDFGTCAGGRGQTNQYSFSARKGNGFTSRGAIIGVLDTPEVNSNMKNINDTTTPFLNGATNGYSGPGGAGLGGNGVNPSYNSGSIGGIGLDPTTITDRFLTQAELQTELIGEVTSGTSYIGGGGSGARSSGKANPPGGCGAVNNPGLPNTGGGGGAGSLGSGGSGFAMLRLPTSQNVTTTGTPSTYIKGDDTVYVWKNTGSITITS